MANQPYYPTREGYQLTWFTNLESKIYGVGDHQVGQWSAEVSVIVGG